MKGAVFHGPHDIRVENIPEPKIELDGVIVKVKACGICGSDLHPYRLGGADGMILGHEFSGDVVEVGANVKGIAEGDRIAAVGALTCGHCYWCEQKQWPRCSNMKLIGYGIPGALAEYVMIPLIELGPFAVKLPNELSYEVGATIEPLSVGLYSVIRAQPSPEDVVVVIGAGAIGLCAIQALKARDVKQIIVSGRRANRLKLAKDSGADIVVDAAQDDILPVVAEATSGKGADIVFECAGSTTTYQQAMDMISPGGKVVLVAIYEKSITWNPSFAVTKDIDLIGCFGEDFPGALELLQNGKADTKPMISHEFPLDKVKEAFETQIEAEDAVKVLIKL